MSESVWAAVHRDLSAVLCGYPDDVPGVVAQLTEMQAVLDRAAPGCGGHPLAEFNALYLRATTCVLEQLYEGGFADPAFLSRLDVEFATRYFDALRQWGAAGAYCPRVWAVLLGRVPGPEHRPLPPAAAGINAHLNFDLPFALVTTFDHLGSDPVDDSDQHHDYLRVNEIFAASVPGLRHGHLDRWQVLMDTINGDLDHWWRGDVADYPRNVAWRTAQKLWAVRHDLPATARERSRLDGNAAALGRLLLSPMAALL